MAENTLPQLKQDLIDYVGLLLGNQIIDLELDPAHFEAAYQKTIGTFSVKGSAIVGFDTMNTVQKTLRKPDTQLKELLSGGKPAARKVFKDIKATEVKYNGRGNENIVILKAW